MQYTISPHLSMSTIDSSCRKSNYSNPRIPQFVSGYSSPLVDIRDYYTEELHYANSEKPIAEKYMVGFFAIKAFKPGLKSMPHPLNLGGGQMQYQQYKLFEEDLLNNKGEEIAPCIGGYHFFINEDEATPEAVDRAGYSLENDNHKFHNVFIPNIAIVSAGERKMVASKIIVLDEIKPRQLYPGKRFLPFAKNARHLSEYYAKDRFSFSSELTAHIEHCLREYLRVQDRFPEVALTGSLAQMLLGILSPKVPGDIDIISNRYINLNNNGDMPSLGRVVSRGYSDDTEEREIIGAHSNHYMFGHYCLFVDPNIQYITVRVMIKESQCTEAPVVEKRINIANPISTFSAKLNYAYSGTTRQKHIDDLRVFLDSGFCYQSFLRFQNRLVYPFNEVS